MIAGANSAICAAYLFVRRVYLEGGLNDPRKSHDLKLEPTFRFVSFRGSFYQERNQSPLSEIDCCGFAQKAASLRPHSRTNETSPAIYRWDWEEPETKSVKRMAEKVRGSGRYHSAVRFTDYKSVQLFIPAVNCWVLRLDPALGKLKLSAAHINLPEPLIKVPEHQIDLPGVSS